MKKFTKNIIDTLNTDKHMQIEFNGVQRSTIVRALTSHDEQTELENDLKSCLFSKNMSYLIIGK